MIENNVWLYPGIAPGWGYYFKPTKTKNPEKKKLNVLHIIA